MEGTRNLIIATSVAVIILSNFFLPFPVNLILTFGALGMSVYGCYLWTKIKNRHPAFMLWGLLTPIGLLGVSLLKDKSPAPGA